MTDTELLDWLHSVDGTVCVRSRYPTGDPLTWACTTRYTQHWSYGKDPRDAIRQAKDDHDARERRRHDPDHDPFEDRNVWKPIVPDV